MWRGDVAMKALAPFFIIATLSATDIDVVIKNTLLHNPTLKVYAQNIEALKYDKQNASLYKNPELTLGINDILFDNVLDRGIEPMQTNFITLTQTIPRGDKLQLQEKLLSSDEDIAALELENLKDKLVTQIYQAAFEVRYFIKTNELRSQKIENLQQIQNYHSKHMLSSQAFEQLLQNDLSITAEKIKIEEQKERIQQIYAQLEEISSMQLQDLQIKKDLLYKKQRNIQEHKLLQIQKKLVTKSGVQNALAKENKAADYTLSVGYYHRESFDDYVSLALKIPLNIYGREENLISKSLTQANRAKANYEKVLKNIESLYTINLSKLKSAEHSLELCYKIDETLDKELGIYKKQSVKNSIIKILELENKKISNAIEIQKYLYDLSIAKVQLSYITSSIRGQ